MRIWDEVGGQDDEPEHDAVAGRPTAWRADRLAAAAPSTRRVRSAGARPTRPGVAAPLGYHSARCLRRHEPIAGEPRAPPRVAVLGAGTVGREVVRALLDRGRRADGRRRRAARARRDRRPRRRPRPAAGGLPAELLTDAPAHLVAADDTDVDRRADGRRRAGPHADRRGARRRQGGRDREQARHRPSRSGARGDGAADRRGAPVRGGGRRRHPGPRPARDRARRATGSTRVRGIVNGTTNYILTRDGRRGPRLRRRARRRPGRRLRRGRPERRRRGPRRGQQARDPRPPRVRRRGSTRRGRPRSPADGPGAGRPGITGVTARRHRRPRPPPAGRSSSIAEARRGAGRRDRARPSLPTAVPRDCAVRPDGRRPEPDRDRGRARRDRRVQRARRRRPGDVERRPRRPHRDRPRARHAPGRACRPPVRAARRDADRRRRRRARRIGPRPTLVERYRAFLPVTDATPVAQPRRGLDAARPPPPPRRPARAAEPPRQGRGPEPDRLVQGPGHGRRGREGASRTARGRSSAPRPATPRRRPPPTAPPHGLEVVVVLPAGKIAMGKLLQALVAGARVVAVDGNFDAALRVVRALAEQDDHPVTLVNSVNPYRLEGQKTGAFEVCDDLGRAPDILAIPVGNAGNISAYWAGFREYAAAGLVATHAARCSASRPPARRRSSSAGRSTSRRRSRPRSGSATRPRGPRRSPPATRAAAGSRRSPTTRSSPPTAPSPTRRASSASRRRRPSVAGVRRAGGAPGDDRRATRSSSAS